MSEDNGESRLSSNSEGIPPEQPVWLRQMPREALDALLMKLIHQVVLLHGMTRNELVQLLGAMQKDVHEAGEFVFREGDHPGHTLHILISGAVEVRRRALGGNADLLVASLKPGETFGEMALVDHKERSASVLAIEPSVTLKISAADLNRFPDIAAKLYFNIARMLTQRLRNANDLLLKHQREVSRLLAELNAKAYQ